MLDVNGRLAGAEVLVTAYSSEISAAIQLSDVAGSTGTAALGNTKGSTRIGGVEAVALWRFPGGKFIGTYG